MAAALTLACTEGRVLPDPRFTLLFAAALAGCVPPVGSGSVGSPGDDTGEVLQDSGINPVSWSLVINEFQAANQSLQVDPASPGSTPDWIELYNPSSIAVPLGGLFISDDAAVPLLHPLPDRELEAGEHLLLFADASPQLGPEHRSFKLGADGETVGIYTQAGEPLDVVVFADLGGNQVAGRLPDGGPLALLSPATPGETNDSAEALEAP